MLFDGRQKKPFIGIILRRIIEQSGADRRDILCYLRGIGAGFLKAILEQESFELVVIDAHGNGDGAEDVITSGETAADFLGDAVEAANGEESVDAGAD